MRRLYFILTICLAASAAWGVPLQVEVGPVWRGAPLHLNEPVGTNVAGQAFSVTRLDFLWSDLALRGLDGAWQQSSNGQGFFSLGQKDNLPMTGAFAPGRYDRIRFHVGLTPNLNHSDPASYPAGHPLNPQVNGLHWGWAGGYIFLALEGLWAEPGSTWLGYSYHLANDPQLMTVELPVALDLTAGKSVDLTFSVDDLLPRQFTSENNTTHSRAGDVLAATLAAAVQHAFAVARVAPLAPVHTNAIAETPDLPPAGAHPYAFTFSARFPRPALPLDNPLTEEGVALGRRLFFEKKLSVNNQQSCASCHQPARAFSDGGHAVSTGAEGASGSRHAMTLFNLAWKRSFFWDGRASSLREQVLMPIQNPVEMHQPLDRAVANLSNDPDYPPLFARAFGTPVVTSRRLALALEQFLLTQVSSDSRLDRALDGRARLSDEEKLGFQLFMTEYDPRRGLRGADCFHCHGGALFQSQTFANNGLDAVFRDRGRSAVTGQAFDQGRFAVPTLRNVELTGPYMHDGRFKTLEEVVAHYCGGVKRSATLDPNLAKHPDGGLPLTPVERKALVAFLKTLTEESLRPAAAASELTRN
jgi:cytochrome c peroxidase